MWEHYALVGDLVDKLQKRGSWCGETHIQKASYIAKHLLRVEIPEQFILYKHGPFSFELRDTLSAMRVEGVLSYQPQALYGPRYFPGPSFSFAKNMFGDRAEANADKLEFTAETVGSRGVASLEKLSTALFVILNAPNASDRERANQLSQIKPHIGADAALQAIAEINNLIQEATIRGLR
jgi:uncharacterized protein YwgA